MPEMLREFPTLVGGVDEAYVAQIWTRELNDGRWEAWVVFVPVTADQPRRTDRDTLQANRAAVHYWASGLTPIYLDGAFARSRPVRVSAA